MNRILTFLKKQKRVFAVITILLITAAVELIANIHALQGGYDSLDISEKIELIEENGEEKYQIRFKPEAPVYVRKICLSGSFPENTFYRITTKEVNGFDAVETGKYSDKIGTYFSSYYTNLNRKVKSLKITMKKPEGMELTGVTLSNRAGVNQFRMLSVLVILSLLYCAMFEPAFLKKTEWYFAVYALAFGILLIVFAQPVCNSWDEQAHFKNVYTISGGRTVTWTQAAWDTAERTNFRCNTKEEYAQLRALMEQRDDEIAVVAERPTLRIPHQFISYLPMALFVWAGKLLHLPFAALFALGKLGNLLFYVTVMFWAIRLAKEKKLLLTFLAMTPTLLFLATAYTYDSVIFSLLTLGCVLWCRETFYAKERMHMPSVIAAGLLFLFGSLSKPVYLPFVLLMLLLPQIRRQKKKVKAALGAGLLLAVALVTLLFVLPVVSNALSGDFSYGGDIRGGDTSVAGQAVSMLRHPWESMKLVAGSVFHLENFRNLGNAGSDSYFFLNLMMLNYSSMGTLSDKWCILLLPLLTLLFLYREDGEGDRSAYRLVEKTVIWLVLLASVLLIWISMYLTFTPVGSEEIAGVQTRYYLPLLYLLSLLFPGGKIRLQIKEKSMVRAALLSANIFQAAAICSLALGSRLL